MKKKGKVKSPPGIWFGKERYFHLKMREADGFNVYYLKKKDGGATIAETKKCIILATWTAQEGSKKNGGNCNMVVEELASAFVEVNY